MSRNKYDELERYLDDKDATGAERRCTRMWVRDGHSFLENDHDLNYFCDEPTDFLMASREKSFRCTTYTESFYDPITQAYIKSQNATPYELRKMREYRRSGGRFIEWELVGMGFSNYLSSLRDGEEVLAAMFNSAYRHDIEEYGAEFLMSKNLAGKFIDFVRNKPHVRNDEAEDDELPF
jgi:hypothetical protein